MNAAMLEKGYEMDDAEKKRILQALRAGQDHAVHGDLLKSAADLIETSWIDGYAAATDVATSVELFVSTEIDAAIKLGVDAVSQILEDSLKSLRSAVAGSHSGELPSS